MLPELAQEWTEEARQTPAGPLTQNIKGPGSLAAEPRSPAPYLSPTLSRT